MADAKKMLRDWLRPGAEVPTSLGAVRIEGPSLGEGGNGLVYPAALEGRAIAAKFLTSDIGEKVERFRREFVRVLLLPSHPGLVRLYHLEQVRNGEQSAWMYLMERCEGSLAGWRRNLKRVPTRVEIDDILNQCARCLDHIHENGVIHRDLKPENILRRADGSLALADFGIARFLAPQFAGTTLTSDGDRVGNALFSAPEQRGAPHDVTPQADIYALGQILYWLVFGEPIRGTGHRRLREVADDLAVFDEVIERCVRQEAADRYAACSEVLASRTTGAPWRQEARREEAAAAFDDLLAEMAPGSRGVSGLVEADKIARFFVTLAAHVAAISPEEVWWIRGQSHMPIRQVEGAGTLWRLGAVELDVDHIWIVRDGAMGRSFALVRSRAMQPFGVYPPSTDSTHEEAGFYEGRYVTREEFDDGYATIDGQTVKLSGALPRWRPLREHYMFVCPQQHALVANGGGTDVRLQSLVDNYESGQPVEHGELEALLGIVKKHRL